MSDKAFKAEQDKRAAEYRKLQKKKADRVKADVKADTKPSAS